MGEGRRERSRGRAKSPRRWGPVVGPDDALEQFWGSF